MRLLVFLAFFIASAAHAQMRCEGVFLVSTESVDAAMTNLADLHLKLELAKIQGSSAITQTAHLYNYQKKYIELSHYLKNHYAVTPEEFRTQLKTAVQKLQGIHSEEKKEDLEARKELAQKIVDASINGARVIMHRIEPGSFEMGPEGKKIAVTLSEAFDMMATPMTQVIWKKIAQLANEKLDLKEKIDEDPSESKGDLKPVEHVSYNDIQIWITALNQLSKAAEPLLVDLIPDHQPGDVYRLPTDIEWEFVARKLGQENGHYHFGEDASELGIYAWHEANSGKETHPVGQKEPLVIGDKEFYDLLGNVGEFVSDQYDRSKRNLSEGVKKSNNGELASLRGGSYQQFPKNLRSSARDYVPKNGRYGGSSFRLARTDRELQPEPSLWQRLFHRH